MRAIVLLFACALLVGCEDKPPAASGDKAAVVAGNEAPDVELSLHDGNKVKLSSLRGSLVLLYFYPKDDTPG